MKRRGNLAFLSGSLRCHRKTWSLKPGSWLAFSLFCVVLFGSSQCCAKLQDCISELETSLALPPNSLPGLVMDDWISWPVINLGDWKGRDQADMSPLRTGLQAPNWFICPFLLIMKKGNGLVQIFYRGIWLRRSYLKEHTHPQPWLLYCSLKPLFLNQYTALRPPKIIFFQRNKRSSLELAEPFSI